jgi:Txe/YoeB family toxin of Txe-Axe toxin-antitoxin module
VASFCLLSNQTSKAVFWYDRIFDRKHKKVNVSEAFYFTSLCDALNAYLAEGELVKAKEVFNLIALKIAKTTGNRASVRLAATAKRSKQGQKGGPRKGRNNHQTKTATSVDELRQMTRNLLKQNCDTLLENLKKISFVGNAERQQTQISLEELQSEALIFKGKVTEQNSAQNGTSESLVTLKRQLADLEVRMNHLKAQHEKAEKVKRKEAIYSAFNALSIAEENLLPEPESVNLRSLYGHEKGTTTTTTTTTTQSDVRPTISTTPDPKQAQEVAPTVTFKMLKSAEKQYKDLQGMPGMIGKYRTMLSEISSNPLHVGKGFGRPKELVGGNKLYSRRFDKANRFVYKVIQMGPHHYEVIILSVRGHYNELAHQLKNLNKK